MRFKLNLLLFLVVTMVLLVSSMFSYFSLRADLTEGYESRKLGLAQRHAWIETSPTPCGTTTKTRPPASSKPARLARRDGHLRFPEIGEGGDSAAGSLLAFRSKLAADPNARGGGGGQLQNEETVRVPLHETFPTTFAQPPQSARSRSRARPDHLLPRSPQRLLGRSTC